MAPRYAKHFESRQFHCYRELLLLAHGRQLSLTSTVLFQHPQGLVLSV